MPRTNQLERDLNTARLEVGLIFRDGKALAHAIEQLVSDFIDRHGGDIDETLAGINDSLSDLLTSVTKDKLREIEGLERTITDLERQDMRRSAPVVL